MQPKRLVGIGVTFTAVVAAWLWSGAATATEGGGSNKALGVDSVLTGLMPSPGMRVT